MSSASSASFSIACASPRTRPSSISSWPNVVTARRPTPRRRSKPERLRTETKKGSGRTGAFLILAADDGLLERGLHAREGRVQLGAEALDHGDDRNRNAGSDKAIFDGGRTGLVLGKTLDQLVHR